MELQIESMEDVEDGEITDSESDSDMKTFGALHQQAPDQPPSLQKSADSVSALKAFEVRDAAATVVSSNVYRSTTQVVSSEESDTDSDNEDRALWKRKRQKCTHHPIPKPLVPSIHTSQKLVPGGRKVNNIWGSVLQEQNQDSVATELGILGMEGNVDMNHRQSETYNYVLAKKLADQQNRMEKIEETAKLDKDLDNYMQKRHTNLKRKRAMKERLGPNIKQEEMDFEGRYAITEEDSEEKVADEIAHRLREQKKDLIARVVKFLGKKKAIELLMETAEIEQNGGLYIADGSRRRTPGGVYLNLLKSSSGITSQQFKDIFFYEIQKESEAKKAAKKRRRFVLAKKMKKVIKSLNLQEHDDASRETFASDTNEALASLEDSHEDPVEMKADPEDAIEIDHGHDLEMF
ncbi:phosphorylated adapter RNA export protein [Protopterus annectens]|uniref:phosphorylated adapter RNA export protein n=1 Tax=Protopterus annectens TaxID=7888 RepID=UPI001CF97202|nr:phosphorylated adapter RNA export protein [Protopterus annectens]